MGGFSCLKEISPLSALNMVKVRRWLRDYIAALEVSPSIIRLGAKKINHIAAISLSYIHNILYHGLEYNTVIYMRQENRLC